MSIHLLEASSQQFQESDLAADIAGCHRRKERPAEQPCCMARIAFEECDKSQLTVGARGCLAKMRQNESRPRRNWNS